MKTMKFLQRFLKIATIFCHKDSVLRVSTRKQQQAKTFTSFRLLEYVNRFR